MSCNKQTLTGRASASGSQQFASHGAQANSFRQASGNGKSQLEQALIEARTPLEIAEREEITVNGERGIFLNRAEVAAWRGSRPIGAYAFAQDANPQVLRKQLPAAEQVQSVNVRFLKPPAGKAGPIIIRQDPSSVAEPAPAVILRQGGRQAATPAPQVIREAPPAGLDLKCKVITVKGSQLPPPPRRVVIERLADLPARPGKVCIDRWLAPEGVQRQVIFQAAPGAQAAGGERNLVIEWSAAPANVRQELRVRGVVEQSPAEYAAKYGAGLVPAGQLPAIARGLQAPAGARLAADAGAAGVQLVGDVHALALVDLEAEGLGEYRQLVQQAAAAQQGSAAASQRAFSTQQSQQQGNCGGARTPSCRAASAAKSASCGGSCGPSPAPANDCQC